MNGWNGTAPAAAPAAAAMPVPFRGKRKLDDDPDEATAPDVDAATTPAEYPRHPVLPRVEGLDARTAAADQPAEFLPLPPGLNESVYRSLQGAPDVSHAARDAAAASGDYVYPDVMVYPRVVDDDTSRQSSQGILQPPAGASPIRPNQMEEDAPASASNHGPQCTSIPQLSVRYHGGTASELWAHCPDCGAFSKVHEDQPVNLCYSP